MADAKVTLKVLLEAAGIKPTTKQLNDLTKSMKGTVAQSKNLSKEQNTTKRNMDGVAQRTGRANKDFGRMSQGMGGLVQAYATVAANVFALSSAFLVLRRAADLSSMTKSAENFSDRFGVSVTRITKQMQEASGGALDFADALPSINKAVSAGVGIQQMEELTVAATKAAQTFGGTTTEALNRFISASQRGRVEIIQTLGVVIKTEQAYKDYAASIGKTALELTAFDRQQAILNATIEESKKVFDGVEIDPNPFQQMLVTVSDLKNVFATFITDTLTPLISTFNKSKVAALALIVAIVSAVSGKIFPALADSVTSFTRAGIESSKKAREIALRASASLLRSQKEQAKTREIFTAKSVEKVEAIYKDSLNDRVKAHGAFVTKIINQEGQIDVAALTSRRAAVAREQAARIRGKGRQTSFSGISDVELGRLATGYDQVASSIEKGNIALKKQELAAKNVSNAVLVSTQKMIAGFAKVRSSIASATSQLKSGFAQSFGAIQSGVGGVQTALLATSRSWKILFRDMIFGGKTISKQFLNIGKVIGRSGGVVAGLGAKILSFASSAILFASLATVAWDTFGKKLFGIDDTIEKIEEAFESLNSSLDEITDRTKGFISSFSKGVKSSSNFIKQLEFIRGTIDTTSNSILDFNSALVKAFGKDLSAVIDDVIDFESQLKVVNEAITETTNLGARPGAIVIQLPKEGLERLKSAQLNLQAAEKATEELNTDLRVTDEIFKAISKDSLPSLVNNFVSLNRLFRSAGMKDLSPTFNKIKKELGGFNQEAHDLVEALRAGSPEAFGEALKALPLREQAIAMNILLEALKGVQERFNAVSAQISATRTLGDLSEGINTFLTGIDKLRTAGGPNKEIVNFFLSAEQGVKSLIATGGKLENLDTIASNLFSGIDLEEFKKFFDLEGISDPEKALTRIQEGFAPFKAILEDTVTKQFEAKAISEQIRAIKLEEASTDEKRLENIGKLNTLEQDRIRNNLRQLGNQRDVVDEQIKFLENRNQQESLVFKILESQREAIRLQIISEDILLQKVKDRKDEEREYLKILKESLKAAISVNQEILKQQKLEAKLATTIGGFLTAKREIFNAEKRALDLKKVSIEKEKESLLFNEKTFEQDKKRELVLNSQLETIRLQTLELEKQQRSIELLGREFGFKGEPLIVFSREGMREGAQLWTEAWEKEIPKLKPTIEVLVNGLKDSFEDIFNSAIDLLLEGGKDFAHNFTEAIKATLRQSIGNALKNDLKNIFTEQFAGLQNLFKTPEQKAEEAKEVSDAAAKKALEEARLQQTMVFQQGMLTATTDQLTAQQTMVTSLDTIATNTMSCCATNAVGITGKEIKEVTPKDLERIFSASLNKSNVTVDSVNNSPTVQNAISQSSDIMTAVAEGNTQGILSGLISLGTTIVSALFTQQATESAQDAVNTAGSFFGGFADGGITKGMRRLADGAVTNGPEIALIGEGQNREAVVPLPNNREIPVDLKGASGDTVEITQNFDFRNADTNSIGQLRAEAKNIEDRTFNRVFFEINKGGKYAKMVGRRG